MSLTEANAICILSDVCKGIVCFLLRVASNSQQKLQVLATFEKDGVYFYHVAAKNCALTQKTRNNFLGRSFLSLVDLP